MIELILEKSSLLPSSVIRSVFDWLLNVLSVCFSFTSWPSSFVKTSNQLEQQNYDQYSSNDSVYARFPSWGTSWCFLSRGTGCMFSHAWDGRMFSRARVGCVFSSVKGWLQVFPLEGLGAGFPARGVGCMFSRSRGWLHVFLLKELGACFPAWGACCMFSRSRDWVHVFSLEELIECFPARGVGCMFTVFKWAGYLRKCIFCVL